MDKQSRYVPVEKMIAHVRQLRIDLRTITIQDYIRQLSFAGLIQAVKGGWLISDAGQHWLIEHNLRDP